MDDRVSEIDAFVVGLAEKEKARLARAGTLVEIEELTASIGDEVSRKLAGAILQELSMTSHVSQTDPCPDLPEWLAGADVVREIASRGDPGCAGKPRWGSIPRTTCINETGNSQSASVGTLRPVRV